MLYLMHSFREEGGFSECKGRTQLPYRSAIECIKKKILVEPPVPYFDESRHYERYTSYRNARGVPWPRPTYRAFFPSGASLTYLVGVGLFFGG
jgi:hypothetical protein